MKKTLLLAFVSMFAMQAQAATQDLIDSVKNGDTNAVLDLLTKGEDVNGTDASGTTALHYAVAYDNDQMTNILLSFGADLNKANNKGWTPLKIAEKKDLKKVSPILAQYNQTADIKVIEPVKESATKAVQAVKDVPAQAAQAAEVKAVAVVEEVKKEAIPQVAAPAFEAKEPAAKVEEVVEIAKADVAEAPVVAVVQEKAEIVKNPVATVAQEKAEIATQTANIENAVAKVESIQNEQMEVIEQAAQAVIDAKSAQTRAEAEAEIMANELKQLRAEKAELEAKLAQSEKAKAKLTEEKQEAKAEVKAEPKAEAKAEPKAEAKAEVKKEVATVKLPPKPVKPVLQKKPVYKAPQPIVKKVEIKPSTMVEGINAGDEEIVYCLDYLGNGESDNMKRAAGYFAASASISEARYKEIVDKANNFFMSAGDEGLTKRDNECSLVITPKDREKQNQIVRSMNKSVGY